MDEYREIAGAMKIENENLREEVKREKEELHIEKNKVVEIADEYNNIYNHLIERDRQLEELK